ncbi:carotenoid biosynthesis protein [Novosphingobium album (ex Liu et al. 2023)]|nr:carotenoid biosynthesis protein [Novosphingobium album (ex Liu et al. 2023)]
MERMVRTAAWAVFALLAYFIVAGILDYWLALPAPGNIGFVPTFTLFSLLHAWAMLGGRRAALFFGLTVVISYIVEELGVRTGVIFGPYHYSDQLGFKLSHVPVLIPLGWFMMIYPSWVVAQALLRGVDVRRPAGMAALALFSALAMTGWDMVMDPPMVRAGVWVWHGGGPYFGVPLRNYVGWVLNTFVIYLVFDAVDRAITRREGAAYRFGGAFTLLPILIYTLFAVGYVAPGRLPPLTVVAVFTMLLPGLLALARVLLPAADEKAR